MATTSPFLAMPFPLGAGSLMGQGLAPEVQVFYSTSDAATDPPTWTQVPDIRVRSWGVSRGRESELQDIDAGTATITLDNRNRVFDPVNNTAIRPMNRWWIREQFTGETQDIFKGYADSYDQQWPAPVGDAVTVVQCTDEFKVLALDRLPTMNPPRDTYADVVAFDGATAYYQFQTGDALQGTVGPNLTFDSGYGWLSGPTASPIVGDPGTDFANRSSAGTLRLTATDYVDTPVILNEVEPWHPSDQDQFTVEMWFKPEGASDDLNVIQGPTYSGGTIKWRLHWNTNETVTFGVRDAGGTEITATTTTALLPNTWYHVVGTLEGNEVNIYVNGVLEDDTGFGSTVHPASPDAGTVVRIGNSASTIQWNFDEVAYYPTGLTAARVLAHYEAGALRGFPGGDTDGLRIGKILDVMGSHAPRRIDTSSRLLSARFQTGQDPLSEIRKAADVSLPDRMFFTARDGTLVFLDHDHRGSSPYNTVQATFDDDGTDLPYLDVDIDYSESFLVNEWNVTTYRGVISEASDASSIARYFKRSQTVSDLITYQDATAAAIAAALLAKHKDPITRIQSITFNTAVPNLAEAILERDLGDRIRVLRTPPGGGTRHDQTLFIQKIEVSGANDGKPWEIRWGVSPV